MNKPSIDIITPVSRPQFLRAIELSIQPLTQYFKTTWWVLYDGLCPVNEPYVTEKVRFDRTRGATYRLNQFTVSDPHSVIGNAQNNFALDNIEPDHWCFFLSDDNIIHHDFGLATMAAIKTMPNIEGFLFHQQVGVGIRFAMADSIRIERIDLAQFLLKRSLIADLRFELGLYQSDGKLVQTLHEQNPQKFYIINKVLAYYNKLR